MAIGLAIVKVCSSKSNSDGTLPTARVKAIWDRLFEDGEVERAFDFHRWKTIRDLIEVRGGLEMVDRRFYTGFVDVDGRAIKGRAAKWHMAGWLVETLDELVGSGQRAEATTGSFSDQDGGGSLPEQESQQDERRVLVMAVHEGGGSLLEQSSEQDEKHVLVMPNPDGGGSLLEHEEGDQLSHLIVRPHDMQGGTLQEQINGPFPHHAHEGTLPEQTAGDQDDFGFEDSWIVEFRRAYQPTIGLIWAGTILESRRVAA